MAITWGYVRVSTDDQGAGLAAQKQAVLSAGVDERHLVVDEGISGTKFDRPGLKRIMAEMRRGDLLVCAKLDRLGRSVYGVLGLFKQLEELGVEVKVLHESIDTTTPAGKLMRNMLLTMAEFERDMIASRTKAALAEIKRTGLGKDGTPKTIGRKKALDDAQRKELLDLYDKGVRIADLARHFKVAPKTIYASLDVSQSVRLQREIEAKLLMEAKRSESENGEKQALQSEVTG
jgi:DNA invertase Pin-like site-specific DNA recombinase